MLTNGVLEKLAGVDARGTSTIARATVPIIPVLPKNNAMWAKIDSFLAEQPGKNDDNIHNFLGFYLGSTGEERVLQTIQMVDLMVQTWPQVRNQGILRFSDQAFEYLMCHKPWLMDAIDNIQVSLTDIALEAQGLPELKMVGYGMFKREGADGLTLQRRPSRFMRFGNNVAGLQLTVDPFTLTQLRMHTAYLATLALQIKKMVQVLGKGRESGAIAGYRWPEDYMALANALIMQISGTGDIKIEKYYQATDVALQVLNMIGVGISEAYPLMFETQDQWEEYIEFVILLGIVAARIKGITLPADLELKAYKHVMRAPDDLAKYTKPHVENFGSIAQPYYMMAQNDIGADFALPAAFSWRKMDSEAQERVCVYDRLLQRLPQFATAEVVHGEITGSNFDPKAPETFVKWNIHPDARQLDIEHTMRILTQWRLPIHGIITNLMLAEPDRIPGKSRNLLFLLNLLANGKASMKDAYMMFPGTGMIRVAAVRSFQNRLYEELIDKGPTSAQGQPSATQPNTTTMAPTGGDNPTMVAPPAPIGKTNKNDDLTAEERSGDMSKVAETSAVNTERSETKPTGK